MTFSVKNLWLINVINNDYTSYLHRHPLVLNYNATKKKKDSLDYHVQGFIMKRIASDLTFFLHKMEIIIRSNSFGTFLSFSREMSTAEIAAFCTAVEA